MKSAAVGLFVVSALSAGLPAVAQAQTFFVATNGSDSNPGTEALPFKTIGKGASALTPGTTVLIKGGTYSESLISYLTIIRSGTSWAAPVTISAYPGARVVMRPASAPNVIDLNSPGLKYLILDGLVLDAVNTVNDPSNLGNGIYIGAGASFIRVKNTEILNAPGQGILTVGGVQGNEFLNLVIHDNGRVRQLTHGMYLDSSNNLVEGCAIYNNAAYQVQVYGSHKPSNNVVRRNRIFNNTRLGNGGGIDISSGSANAVYNNAIWGHVDQAINVAWGPSGTLILNNTIANQYGIYINTDSSGTVVRNNIVYGSNPPAIDNRGVGTAMSNNLLSDPMFVDRNGADFHLRPGSPAIDAGVSVPEVTNDLDGTPRPLPFDIGAYEWRSTTTSLSAPTRIRFVP